MTFQERLNLWILGCGVRPEDVLTPENGRLKMAVEDEDPVDTMRALQNLPYGAISNAIYDELQTPLQQLEFLGLMRKN
jgi:hypothetical protein